ncbi:MAG: hypothetical protein AABX89_02760 [Candidatus Thermoplasmatota archaeon]
MKLQLAVLALFALMTAPVLADDVAPEALVTGVFLDAFVPVPLDTLVLNDDGCASSPGASLAEVGVLSVDGAGTSFHWSEDDSPDSGIPGVPSVPSLTPPGQPAGYLVRSCASVSFTMPIPPSTDHVHLRFDASREIACASTNVLCPRFAQRLILTSPGGAALAGDYFNFTDGAYAARPIDLPAYRPAGLLNLSASWFFQDISSSVDPSAVGIRPNGASYASAISRPVVEFSSIPVANAAVETQERRAGSQVFNDILVSVSIAAPTVAEGLGTDLRMRFDPQVVFSELRAPDGAVLTEAVTRSNDGPNGFDRSKILVERTAEFTQITVPGQLIREHGAGTYTLVETLELPLSNVPALIPFAALLLVVPVPFAIVAARQAHIFEREAFGGFRASARNLRVALALISLYYLAVVGGALLGGGAAEMTTLPLSVTGLFLYLQLALAALSFAALYLVARALYRITVPPPLPNESDAP